jgi:hypothetical protein
MAQLVCQLKCHLYDPKLADEICTRRRFLPMSAKSSGMSSTFDTHRTGAVWHVLEFLAEIQISKLADEICVPLLADVSKILRLGD